MNTEDSTLGDGFSTKQLSTLCRYSAGVCFLILLCFVIHFFRGGVFNVVAGAMTAVFLVGSIGFGVGALFFRALAKEEERSS